jgi:hypothetical protein
LTQGFIEFAQEGLWLDEESGKAEFGLKLHRPFGNNAAMTVNFETVDGTAKAGVDYVAKSGTVTWFAGEAGEKTVTVSIINDTALRADRSFTLRLTGASQADLASQRESSCTVVDLYQSFAARNQIAVGWNYGVGVQHGQTQAIIKFERTGGTDGAITFTNFQTIGSQMKAGVDFELPNTLSVSWAAGEGGVKTVSVPLLNTDVAITEPKLFTISADGTYEGTTMVNSLAATVVVVPPGMEVPPVVDTARLQRILENFSFSVSTLQGAMVELEKSLNGLTSWVTAAEARADDGEVQFNAPLSTSDNAGFFRIKVKP